MDYARVITLVTDSLSDAGHPCAVIGGVSMAAYGMIRTTLDLDLVTVVAAQEHLAAMKVYAIRNDPSRKFRELEDIRYLLNLPGVNREEIRRYFEINGLEAEYAVL